MAPFSSTTLTIEQVDEFLLFLSELTEENDQVNHFKKFLPFCTAGDLDCIVKLIMHDLRINLKSKDILEAIHPGAYSAFLSCSDVTLAVKQCFSKFDDSSKSEPPTKITDENLNEYYHDINKDNTFKEFRRLVTNIRNENNFANKTNLLTDMFTFGSDGVKFKGNIITWCKLLLPDQNPKICKKNIDQLLNLFSKIFDQDMSEMFQHLDQSVRINDTIVHFYVKKMTTSMETNLSIDQVDEFLEVLSKLTKEDEQVKHFEKFLPYCTVGDLDCIVLLMRHNLNMGLEPKYILESVHTDAYSAFLSSGDITLSINKCLSKSLTESAIKKKIDRNINLLILINLRI